MNLVQYHLFLQKMPSLKNIVVMIKKKEAIVINKHHLFNFLIVYIISTIKLILFEHIQQLEEEEFYLQLHPNLLYAVKINKMVEANGARRKDEFFAG